MVYTIIRLVKQIRRRRRLGVLSMLTLLLASVIGNAITFYCFETPIRPELTLSDSFWYSIISITTIGYGDYHATTLGSRIGTVIFVVFFGLAAFTTTAGMLIDWIVDLRVKEQTGMSSIQAKNHLLIINFPNEARVRQIVEEFVSDTTHRRDEIIIVSNSIDSIPFSNTNVSFVRGSPLEEDTYQRALVTKASKVIVLSTSYDDPSSDSVVASVVSIVHYLNPRVRIVAECLNPQHELLFSNITELSLVYTLHMANNLLVQETQDPGVTALTRAITSNLIKGTMASTEVDSPIEKEVNYQQKAAALLIEDVNLVGVIRGQDVHFSFNEMNLWEGDRLVYISGERHSWSVLKSKL